MIKNKIVELYKEGYTHKEIIEKVVAEGGRKHGVLKESRIAKC